MENNLYKRIAMLETEELARKSDEPETLRKAYDNACQERNAEDAALFARRLRNKLLDLSDKEMTLDRLSLDTSSAAKFISSLTHIFNSAWAAYRQALRDLPQQEGFPFDVQFPAAPDLESGGDVTHEH